MSRDVRPRINSSLALAKDTHMSCINYKSTREIDGVEPYGPSTGLLAPPITFERFMAIYLSANSNVVVLGENSITLTAVTFGCTERMELSGPEEDMKYLIKAVKYIHESSRDNPSLNTRLACLRLLRDVEGDNPHLDSSDLHDFPTNKLIIVTSRILYSNKKLKDFFING